MRYSAAAVGCKSEGGVLLVDATQYPYLQMTGKSFQNRQWPANHPKKDDLTEVKKPSLQCGESHRAHVSDF